MRANTTLRRLEDKHESKLNQRGAEWCQGALSLTLANLSIASANRAASGSLIRGSTAHLESIVEELELKFWNCHLWFAFCGTCSRNSRSYLRLTHGGVVYSDVLLFYARLGK